MRLHVRLIVLKPAPPAADADRMSGFRRPGVIGVLVAAVAVLLPGGVLVATAVGGSGSDPPARVGAAGIDVQGVAGEQASTSSTVTTTRVTVPAVPTTTLVLPPASTVSTRPSATSTSVTTSTIDPRPGSTTSTSLVVALPASPSTWSAERDGVRLRMRMEPSAPVAGQPVRFFFDISSTQPCCATGLSFGDSTDYVPVAPGNCSANAKVTDFPVSHTYASSGVYKVQLVAATFPCNPTTVNGVPVMPTITGTDITACIAVGPGVVAIPGRC